MASAKGVDQETWPLRLKVARKTVALQARMDAAQAPFQLNLLCRIRLKTTIWPSL